MSSETSDVDAVSFETITEQMSDDRGRLLATIARVDDGIPTGRLREATGVPSGSMHYHMSHLEDWGLVQVSEHRDQGRGSPSKVWTITDRGRKYLDRDTAPTSSSPAQLHGRIEELENDVEALKTAYNELADTIEELVNEERMS